MCAGNWLPSRDCMQGAMPQGGAASPYRSGSVMKAAEQRAMFGVCGISVFVHQVTPVGGSVSFTICHCAQILLKDSE